MKEATIQKRDLDTDNMSDDVFDDDFVNLIMSSIMTAAIVVIMLQMLPVTRTAQQYFNSQLFQGVTDPRPVDANSTLQYLDLVHNEPHTPWSYAHFFNNGPNEAEIGINNPASRFIILPFQHYTISRLGASERIGIIYYICKPGETARVDITGEY